MRDSQKKWIYLSCDSNTCYILLKNINMVLFTVYLWCIIFVKKMMKIKGIDIMAKFYILCQIYFIYYTIAPTITICPSAELVLSKYLSA